MRDQAVEARRAELLADEDLLTSAQGQQEWLALLNYRNQALEAATLKSPQKQREQHDPIVAGDACVECAARGKLVRFSTFRPRVWCANCGRYVCGGCAPSKV
jgi:acetyl-CoA carboxylase beta subunit